MFGKKKNQASDGDESQIEKIRDRLDPGESVVMHTTQSRVRPGGAAVLTPNTIFLTQKRVIIRNPTRLGLGENIEEYYYRQITNVRLEKGLLSASLIFSIPGMTEISKAQRNTMIWGRDAEGTIDAISKDVAEKMYEYVRNKINEAKQKGGGSGTGIGSDNNNNNNNADGGGAGAGGGDDDALAILKKRYAKGEITREEYEEIRTALDDGS